MSPALPNIDKIDTSSKCKVSLALTKGQVRLRKEGRGETE